MSALAELERVRERLGSIRANIRLLFFFEGLARTLIAIFAFFVASFALDYLLDLPRQVRIVILTGGAVWIAILVIRKIIYRLAVPISDDDLALLIERHHPELEDRFISAVQFARTRDDEDQFSSPELVDRLIEDAAKASASINFRGILTSRGTSRLSLTAGVLWVLVTLSAILPVALHGWFGWFQEYTPIYLQRLVGGDVRWPQMVRMEVLGDFKNKRLVVARGDKLTIAGKIILIRPEATIPGEARLDYTYESGVRDYKDGWPKGDKFFFEIGNVNSPFKFTISSGDDTTDTYYVDIVNPPGLEEINLFYTYPEYLRLEDTARDRPEINGNVNAPMLTRVRFMARASEPLLSAQLIIGPRGKERTIDLRVGLDARGIPVKVEGEFEVRWARAHYQLIFRAKNGLSNEKRDPIRFTIKGKIDKSPQITVLDPVGNEDISELCVRPFEIAFKDDFGIREAGFEYKVNKSSSEWTYVPFTRENNQDVEYGATKILTLFEPGLDVTKFKVKPGDYIYVRFRASDYKDIGQRNITVSKEFRFEVKSLTELQKSLEKEIENIRSELAAILKVQDRLKSDVDRFRRDGLSDKDLLQTREAGLIRNASLDQNDVRRRITRARKAIARVRRRGVYNRVFEEAQTKELTAAEDILEQLVGDSQGPGPAPLAISHLQAASKVRTRGSRRTAFREAQTMQVYVIQGIKEAIKFLARWSTFQEIIRKAREAKKAQEDINKGIKGTGNKKKKKDKDN